MENVEELLESARDSEKVKALTGDYAAGAEGFFQALQYVARDNPGLSARQLRKTAMDYFATIASPPGGSAEDYVHGAMMGRKIVKQLQ